MTKAEFRRTSDWKNFRSEMLQNFSADYLTGYPLRKGFNIHHLDMRDENYSNLNPERFVCLNKSIHEMVHLLYGYYVKDPDILNRIKDLLDKMIEYNNDEVK
jgi:hypothetical protein